jgi:hypothetical protein
MVPICVKKTLVLFEAEVRVKRPSTIWKSTAEVLDNTVQHEVEQALQTAQCNTV